ncbi:hypothetical protein BJY01DRAFT_246748 [Aspergillus pseudoustus]|uniref:Uncharacterized protein n=1 Tax=Aspergillus pseudoustus TaxID=1810923 RepID=A0ABR4K5D6_9EURO
MNALKPGTRVDIIFIETTDPACVMLVWCADGDTVFPSSFLTIRFRDGEYIENSYLEEGGIVADGAADPFHKSAHWIAKVPADRVDYLRKMVRLGLPGLRDWSIDVLLDPLRREGFINEETASDAREVVMGIMAANREIVEMKEAEEKKA